jgi:hypothetical protein
MIVLWVIVMTASAVASLIVLFGLTQAKSAPQEASAFALALAVAVIPYIFARCFEALSQQDWRQAMRAQLGELVDLTRRTVPAPTHAPTAALPVGASPPATPARRRSLEEVAAMRERERERTGRIPE